MNVAAAIDQHVEGGRLSGVGCATMPCVLPHYDLAHLLISTIGLRRIWMRCR